MVLKHDGDLPWRLKKKSYAWHDSDKSWQALTNVLATSSEQSLTSAPKSPKADGTQKEVNQHDSGEAKPQKKLLMSPLHYQ